MSLPENRPEKVIDFFDGARKTGKDIRVPEVSCEEYRGYIWERLRAGVDDPDVSDNLSLQMKAVSMGHHGLDCQKMKCSLISQVFHQSYFVNTEIDLDEIWNRFESLED